MSQNVTVSVPHKLGKEEASRRIKSGMEKTQQKAGGLMQFTDSTWTGDRLAFDVSMLGQNAKGTIDVRDDHVMIDVALPWLLAKMAEQAKVLIEKQGHRLLEHKK